MKHLLFPLLGLVFNANVMYGINPLTSKVGNEWLVVSAVYLLVFTKVLKMKPSLMELEM